MNRIPPHTTNNEAAPKSKPLTKSHQILNQVRDSEQFRDRLSAAGETQINGDRLTRIRQAFSEAALTLSGTNGDGSDRDTYRDIDSYYYSLAGQISDFVASTEALKDSRNLTYAEKSKHKRRLIRFNHELRDLVDSYQRIKPSELSNYLTETYIILNQQGWSPEERAQHIASTKELIDNRMYGMWGEINAELIVGTAGYDIDTEVSYENELKGIDGWVEMRPGEWMEVDFKCNRNKAERINEEHPDRNALWTHLTRQEFDEANSFRIPQWLADMKAGAMTAALEARWEHYQQYRHTKHRQHSYA